MSLLLGFLAVGNVALAVDLPGTPTSSSDTQKSQAVALPDPLTLTADWFGFFSDASKESLPQRADQMNQRLSEIKAGLAPSSPVRALITQLQLQVTNYAHSASTTTVATEPVFVPPQSLDLADALRLNRKLDMLRSAATLTEIEIKKKDSQINSLQAKLADIKAKYLSLSSADPDRLKTGLEIMQARFKEAADSQYLKRLKQTHKNRAKQIAAMSDFLSDQAAARLIYSANVQRSWDEEKQKLSTRLDDLKQPSAGVGISGPGLSESDQSPALSQSSDNLLRLNQILDETRRAFLNARIDLLAEGLTFNHDLKNTSKVTTTPLLERLDTLKKHQKDWARQLSHWQDDLALQRKLIRSLGHDAGVSQGGTGAQSSENKSALLQQVSTIQDNLDQLSATLADVDALTRLENQWITLHQGVWARWIGELRQNISGWRDTLGTLFTASLFQINDTPVTVTGLLRVLLILIVAWWVSKALRNGLARITAKRPGFNPSSVYTLGKVLHYAIITFGVMFALSSIGLDLSKFALLVSALGVGIGFGLQTLVSNFVSGMILLFERSLKIGDFVELQSGVSGEVRQINIRSTLVTTNDNIDIVIPNSEFVNGRVINWTMHEAARRVHIPFGVAYGTDKDLVRRAVLEAARKVPFTLDQPGREPQVWLVNFGDSSLNFELVVWLNQEGVKKPGAVNATYNWAIETALTQHNIEIPFPQRDVHIRSTAAHNPIEKNQAASD